MMEFQGLNLITIYLLVVQFTLTIQTGMIRSFQIRFHFYTPCHRNYLSFFSLYLSLNYEICRTFIFDLSPKSNSPKADRFTPPGHVSNS